MRRVSSRLTPRWPFWLLIAAWVCANSPQAASYALLDWLVEVPSFSHQRRLTTDVAFLLAGEKTPVAAVKATPDAPPASPLPAVPADAVLKKGTLSFERVVEFLPPVLRPGYGSHAGAGWPDSLRAPPRHRPPRLNAA